MTDRDQPVRCINCRMLMAYIRTSIPTLCGECFRRSSARPGQDAGCQKSTLAGRTAKKAPGSTISAASALQDAPTAVFQVRLPYPPSVNHLWRRVGTRTLVSAEGRRYATSAGVAVALVLSTGVAIPRPPHDVTVVVYVPDQRRRDLDNVLKAVIDPVYKAFGIDDSAITDLHAHKRYDAARVGVLVTVATARSEGRDDVAG